MLIENLKKANELADKIKKCKDQIKIWENCISYYDDSFRIKTIDSWGTVYMKHMPFDILKTISLDGFKKELKELETEFENLK